MFHKLTWIKLRKIWKNFLIPWPKAKAGLYSDKSFKGLPEEFLKKFFTKVNDHSYQISEEVKACVDFRQHNLLKDEYPKNLDLIVCRNVLIYFVEEAKNEIYAKFSDSLSRKGVLFVGSSEQIVNCREFDLEAVKTYFYEKKF